MLRYIGIEPLVLQEVQVHSVNGDWETVAYIQNAGSAYKACKVWSMNARKTSYRKNEHGDFEHRVHNPNYSINN
jgi:hypothetical protein